MELNPIYVDGMREGKGNPCSCGAYTRCHRVMIADSMMDWFVWPWLRHTRVFR